MQSIRSLSSGQQHLARSGSPQSWISERSETNNSAYQAQRLTFWSVLAEVREITPKVLRSAVPGAKQTHALCAEFRNLVTTSMLEDIPFVSKHLMLTPIGAGQPAAHLSMYTTHEWPVLQAAVSSPQAPSRTSSDINCCCALHVCRCVSHTRCRRACAWHVWGHSC